jgi:hypothetical protein
MALTLPFVGINFYLNKRGSEVTPKMKTEYQRVLDIITIK